MRKIRDEQKGIIFIALIVLIIIAVSVFFALSLKTNVVQEQLDENQLIKVLFVVQDDDNSALFTSVVIYNPESHKGALINIPGYTGAIYQSLGRTDRIDMVYNEKGIASYKKEIENLLGIQMPYTIEVTLDNFIMLSDYLGGMRIFISEPIDVVSEDGERWLLPSGAVNLDGDKINAYLHYRLEDESEAAVQERYQNVMAAIITGIHDKKFNMFNKANFGRYEHFFACNIDKEEEKTLFEALAETDTETLFRQTITGSLRNVDGQVLLTPLNNGENVRNNVRQVTNMLTPTGGVMNSRVYVLEIQNGTTVQGLARNTSILFQNASYDVLSAINADRNDYEETIIIDRIGNAEAAKMIGDFIHCTNIQQPDTNMEDEDGSRANVDFTIILGSDFNGQYVVKSRSSK